MAKMILKKHAHIDKVRVRLRRNGIVVKRRLADGSYVIHGNGKEINMAGLCSMLN